MGGHFPGLCFFAQVDCFLVQAFLNSLGSFSVFTGSFIGCDRAVPVSFSFFIFAFKESGGGNLRHSVAVTACLRKRVNRRVPFLRFLFGQAGCIPKFGGSFRGVSVFSKPRKKCQSAFRVTFLFEIVCFLVCRFRYLFCCVTVFAGVSKGIPCAVPILRSLFRFTFSIPSRKNLIFCVAVFICVPKGISGPVPVLKVQFCYTFRVPDRGNLFFCIAVFAGVPKGISGTVPVLKVQFCFTFRVPDRGDQFFRVAVLTGVGVLFC